MSSIAAETQLRTAVEAANRWQFFKKGEEPLVGEHQLRSYIDVLALAGAGR
jgi:hypothetical protein